MSELKAVLKTLKSLNKIVLEKKVPNKNAEYYKLGYTDALKFAISLVKEKLYEAEEKENA